MGNKRVWIFVVGVLFIWGCVTTGQKPAKTATAPAAAPAKAAGGKLTNVALVSLIVRNYGGMYGHMGVMPTDLIKENMAKVLSTTESTLGNYWKVKPVAAFVADKTYQGFAKGAPPPDYITGMASGKAMPVMFTAGNDYIKGNISKDAAQKLCSTLGVDGIVLVYSEWSIQTGRMVPTTKALTKNCVTMYDKTGQNLFFSRKDVLGSANIGSAYSQIHIDKTTIGHWLEAYESGIKTVLDKEGKKLK